MRRLFGIFFDIVAAHTLDDKAVGKLVGINQALAVNPRTLAVNRSHIHLFQRLFGRGFQIIVRDENALPLVFPGQHLRRFQQRIVVKHVFGGQFLPLQFVLVLLADGRYQHFLNLVKGNTRQVFGAGIVSLGNGIFADIAGKFKIQPFGRLLQRLPQPLNLFIIRFAVFRITQQAVDAVRDYHVL